MIKYKKEYIYTDKSSRLCYQIVEKYEDIPSHPSSLRFLYGNLRSIRTLGKFDEIKCLLHTIRSTTHVLIFTETWNHLTK